VVHKRGARKHVSYRPLGTSRVFLRACYHPLFSPFLVFLRQRPGFAWLKYKYCYVPSDACDCDETIPLFIVACADKLKSVRHTFLLEAATSKGVAEVLKRFVPRRI